MARPHRLDYPGARHHVMNRGARHAPIFVDDASYTAFLAILAELPERFGVRIHAYALMPNHFHLLVESVRGNLSRVMRHVGAAYVAELNRVQQWDGPLFRGRFRNRVVETDAYWAHALAYLHLNPVKAGIVASPSDWAWTSHRAYAGVVPAPPWLTTVDLLEQLGGVQGYRDYLADVQAGREVADGFDPESLWSVPRTVHTPQVEADLARGRDVAVAPDPQEEMRRLATVLAVSVDELREGHRGRKDNRRRWFAAWWLVYGAGLPQREVARMLGGTDAQVSRWVARVPTLGEDAELAEWKRRIRER